MLDEEEEDSQIQSTSTTTIYLLAEKRNLCLTNMSLLYITRKLRPCIHLDRGRLFGPSRCVIQPAYMSSCNSVMGTHLRRYMSQFNEYAVWYGLPAADLVKRSLISQHERFNIPENIQYDLTVTRDHK